LPAKRMLAGALWQRTMADILELFDLDEPRQLVRQKYRVERPVPEDELRDIDLWTG
jgi:hypothetical protein